MPYISGPIICSDSFSNGVPFTARRARVFFSTRRYSPDLRAFARSSVIALDVQAAVLRDDDRLRALASLRGDFGRPSPASAPD